MVLTREQTAALEGTGFAVAVIGPGCWPGDDGRAVLYLIECSQARADAAGRVAMGKSDERRRPTPKP